MSQTKLVIRYIGSSSYTKIITQDDYDFAQLHLKLGNQLEILSTCNEGVKAHHLLFPQLWPNDNWDELIANKKQDLIDYEIKIKKIEDNNNRIKQLQVDGKHCICYEIAIGEQDEVEDSYTVEEFIKKMEPDEKSQLILLSLKEGNVVDTYGFRGLGVWYFDGLRLHKSLGEYGYTLPPQAFAMVEKHGLSYFGDDATGCCIVALPQGLTICANGSTVLTDGTSGLSIEIEEEGTDRLTINGQSYQTSYYDPHL
jgi:hypothetical protein